PATWSPTTSTCGTTRSPSRRSMRAPPPGPAAHNLFSLSCSAPARWRGRTGAYSVPHCRPSQPPGASRGPCGGTSRTFSPLPTGARPRRLRWPRPSPSAVRRTTSGRPSPAVARACVVCVNDSPRHERGPEMLTPNPFADEELIPEPSPLDVIRTGDWLDQQHFPPVAWAVPGLIPEGFGLLTGAPKI